MTITGTKNLLLASAAVLSLGLLTACAQSTVPASSVQSGGSDVGTSRYAPPFNGDYGDLANPG
jgi:hypothetical protein